MNEKSNSDLYSAGEWGGGDLSSVDYVSLLLYFVIVVIGCVSVFSSSYDQYAENIFSFSHNYIKQIVWVAVSMVVALFVLLINSNIIHKYTYILYIGGIILLSLTLLFGREVNGAKAWFEFGPIRLQPVELVKIATSLTLARVMSEPKFSITSIKGLATIGVVLMIPLAIIVLQNDTGSGIVFGTLLFVLYREGLSSWLTVPPIIIATLFTLSLVIAPFPLTLIVIMFATIFDAAMSGSYSRHITIFAYILLATLLLSLGCYLFFGEGLSLYGSLISVVIMVMGYLLFHAIHNSQFDRAAILGFTSVAMAFIPLSNYIFENVLRPHQQNRIMSFLGMISDPLGNDYNVNQAKIAIGSGGVLGKGFLEGTQIRYGFVPERHTDFIFCSVAEEWGFVGSLVLLGCFCALILRLMYIGERQNNAFGRIYCYCVAAILLFHLFVNVGMTIGLFPVMGIPLPLVSYGGSSLLAFTIMIFLAIRMSSSRG